MNTYVYAYNDLSVRLAVPLPWHTHLASNLRHYMATEVPLTLISLLILPWLLSIRQYRSFFCTSSVLKSSYHLLSGNGLNSLIHPSAQGLLVLIICGLVSLLIQFPINLLKGEVVSSPYERRIQPSDCTVRFCESVNYRGSWFNKDPEKEGGINFIEFVKEPGEQGSVTKANLHERCPSVSLMTSGMLNWTQLTLLAQYHVLCNEPELMKLQLTYFNRKLLFERIETAQTSHPICSIGTSHGGHVLYREHARILERILEHDLVKHGHVRAALFPNDTWENNFWKRPPTEGNWGDPKPVKKKTEAVITYLEKKYVEHKMFGNSESLYVISLASVELILMIFFGLCLSFSLVLVQEACGWKRRVFRKVAPSRVFVIRSMELYTLNDNTHNGNSL